MAQVLTTHDNFVIQIGNQLPLKVAYHNIYNQKEGDCGQTLKFPTPIITTNSQQSLYPEQILSTYLAKSGLPKDHDLYKALKCIGNIYSKNPKDVGTQVQRVLTPVIVFPDIYDIKLDINTLTQQEIKDMGQFHTEKKEYHDFLNKFGSYLDFYNELEFVRKTLVKYNKLLGGEVKFTFDEENRCIDLAYIAKALAPSKELKIAVDYWGQEVAKIKHQLVALDRVGSFNNLLQCSLTKSIKTSYLMAGFNKINNNYSIYYEECDSVYNSLNTQEVNQIFLTKPSAIEAAQRLSTMLNNRRSYKDDIFVLEYSFGCAVATHFLEDYYYHAKEKGIKQETDALIENYLINQKIKSPENTGNKKVKTFKV